MSSYLIFLFYLYILIGCLIVVDSQQEKPRMSNKICKLDSDCKPNSVCYGNSAYQQGKCSCIDGFVIPNKTGSYYECVKIAESIGSQCTHDLQCEITLGVNSECNEHNKCDCIRNAHYIKNDNSCYLTAKLNESCLTHENCLSDFNDVVYCTNGKCTCSLQHRPNSEGKCIKYAYLFQECNSDESCVHVNAVCRNKSCKCKEGFVIDDEELSCINAASIIGAECQQESQCSYLQNSKCHQNRCECKFNYHSHSNRCFESKSLDEICNDRRECIRRAELAQAVDCVKNICKCKEGFNPAEDCAKYNKTNVVEIKFISLLFSILIFMLI